MEEDVLREALIKKALGYESNEVVEEYLPDDSGSVVLSKRKVTKKFNPPDISALKLLLEQGELSDEKISRMTDSELEAEMNRLLQTLKEKEKEENENGDL